MWVNYSYQKVLHHARHERKKRKRRCSVDTELDTNKSYKTLSHFNEKKKKKLPDDIQLFFFTIIEFVLLGSPIDATEPPIFPYYYCLIFNKF